MYLTTGVIPTILLAQSRQYRNYGGGLVSTVIMVVVWSWGVIRWWFELVRVVRLSGQDQDKSRDNVLTVDVVVVWYHSFWCVVML